jgi:6-phosphogluconate dehydrogenase
MHRAIYIMGVSGSGKTTIGKLLSQKMNIPFVDGDDYHPASNINKLKSGIPLNDNDREGWLHSINEMAKTEVHHNDIVIACSGLRDYYRDMLTADIPKSVCIFLDGDYDLIYKRMLKRKKHFMPVGLLQSQFESLEKPSGDYIIDINKNPEEIINEILAYLSKV